MGFAKKRFTPTGSVIFTHLFAWKLLVHTEIGSERNYELFYSCWQPWWTVPHFLEIWECVVKIQSRSFFEVWRTRLWVKYLNCCDFRDVGSQCLFLWLHMQGIPGVWRHMLGVVLTYTWREVIQSFQPNCHWHRLYSLSTHLYFL